MAFLESRWLLHSRLSFFSAAPLYKRLYNRRSPDSFSLSEPGRGGRRFLDATRGLTLRVGGGSAVGYRWIFRLSIGLGTSLEYRSMWRTLPQPKSRRIHPARKLPMQTQDQNIPKASEGNRCAICSSVCERSMVTTAGGTCLVIERFPRTLTLRTVFGKVKVLLEKAVIARAPQSNVRANRSSYGLHSVGVGAVV